LFKSPQKSTNFTFSVFNASIFYEQHIPHIRSFGDSFFYY
jgi:hypothetical protein